MSNHDTHSAEHHHDAIAEIKKVTIILSVLTIVELILGFWMIGMESEGLRLAVKGAIVILMMAKAFYIVAYFMHLKFEKLGLIYSIIVPLIFIIFFIVWMLYEGNFWMQIRL